MMQPLLDELGPLAGKSLNNCLIDSYEVGGQNWTPPTYDPDTGLLYINAAQGYEIHYKWDVEGPTFGSAGHASHAVGGIDTSLRALDPRTGKAKWIHRYQGTEWNPPRPELLGGLLSTAGHLVFAGAPGNFVVAYDPVTGRQLWHAGVTAPMSNTPITYMLDWNRGENNLVWHVIYGPSRNDAKLVADVDATTGEFIRKEK